METNRIPTRDELSGALVDATQDELLALGEFAAWAQKHQTLLASGRRHGIRIGVTPEVADFIRRCAPTPECGESIAANFVPLKG